MAGLQFFNRTLISTFLVNFSTLYLNQIAHDSTCKINTSFFDSCRRQEGPEPCQLLSSCVPSPISLPLMLYSAMLSCFPHVQLFATPWTVARQAPLTMGFSRPCPSPGDLLAPGIKSVPLTSPALSSEFFTTSITWEAH